MTENNGSDESQLWELGRFGGDGYLWTPANKPELAVICNSEGGLLLADREKAKHTHGIWLVEESTVAMDTDSEKDSTLQSAEKGEIRVPYWENETIF